MPPVRERERSQSKTRFAGLSHDASLNGRCVDRETGEEEEEEKEGDTAEATEKEHRGIE